MSEKEKSWDDFLHASTGENDQEKMSVVTRFNPPTILAGASHAPRIVAEFKILINRQLFEP